MKSGGFAQAMVDRTPSYKTKQHRKKSGLVMTKGGIIRRDMRIGRKQRFL